VTFAYSILETVYGQAVGWVDGSGALSEFYIGVERCMGRIESRGDVRDDAALEPVARQLVEYSQGLRKRFELRLAPRGRPFQLAVWRELTKIPFGETRSYGQIANALGRPDAARAVGAANGANPIMLIIPCHRVIGADGRLVGFGGGLPLKAQMLAFERERASPQGDLFTEDRKVGA
jgi:methylated-DNA-[protein]-cysteine S-methyltransferase